jgi:hypothetical protein
MKTYRQLIIATFMTAGLYASSAIADEFVGPATQTQTQNKYQNQYQYKTQQGAENGQGKRYQYNKQNGGTDHSGNGSGQKLQKRQGKH